MMGSILKTILAPPAFCYGLSEALLDGETEAKSKQGKEKAKALKHRNNSYLTVPALG